MTEILFDLVRPKEFVLPILSGTYTQQPKISGCMYISGNNVCVRTGTKLLILSGAFALTV